MITGKSSESQPRKESNKDFENLKALSFIRKSIEKIKKKRKK
jgi:hypothetical protein